MTAPTPDGVAALLSDPACRWPGSRCSPWANSAAGRGVGVLSLGARGRRAGRVLGFAAGQEVKSELADGRLDGARCFPGEAPLWLDATSRAVGCPRPSASKTSDGSSAVMLAVRALLIANRGSAFKRRAWELLSPNLAWELCANVTSKRNESRI